MRHKFPKCGRLSWPALWSTAWAHYKIVGLYLYFYPHRNVLVVFQRVQSDISQNVETASELVALDVEADCALHESSCPGRRQVVGEQLLGGADVGDAGAPVGDETETAGARWLDVVDRVANAHARLLHQSGTHSKAKAKTYNTCIAPHVTYRDFRGAGTTQARADVQPIQLGCCFDVLRDVGLYALENDK